MDPEDLRPFTEYVRGLFAPEDDVLRELARRTAASDAAPMQITSEVGKLLHVLARAAGARRALELGTLFGYSTIWIARALPLDGRLVTIDLDGRRAEEARSWLARAGVAERVEIRVGAALDVLPALRQSEPFDFAFVDAAKEEYPAYLDRVLPLVRPGGIIAADNVLLGGGGSVLAEGDASPGVRGVREFNRRIAEDPRLASIVLPVREGVSVSVVLPSRP
ncbi:MAG TPA: O-methyltransferase [Gemmatimonadota bacterium]|jgi:predicted O-methyltransferase YrrM